MLKSAFLMLVALGNFWQSDFESDRRSWGELPKWATTRAIKLGKPFDCTSNATNPPGRDPVKDWNHTIGNARIRVHPFEQIDLQGLDSMNLPWRVETDYRNDGNCRVFVHDLDRNGFVDFIFLTYNEANNDPDFVTIIVISFDHLGRPVVWRVDGPFLEDGDRILNLVDLNGDGRAELLYPYMQNDGNGMYPDNYGSRLTLYRISDGYFTRADGLFAGHEFPYKRSQFDAKVSWADEPVLNNSPGTAAPTNLVAAAHLTPGMTCGGVNVTLEDGQIRAVPPPAEPGSCERYLQVGKNRKVMLPEILVIDVPGEGRQIDIGRNPEQIIQKAMKLRMGVTFAGRVGENPYSPMIMWARPSPTTP